MKTGVLLMNLGTPDAPTPEKVGEYLTEFLMDPDVIDIAFVLRWLLVHALIVPRRAAVSAAQYRKIWTDNGSPLLHLSRLLTEKTQAMLGGAFVVRLGMRYGRPSFDEALGEIRAAEAERVVALPLYPQYSLAATESSLTWLGKAARRVGLPRTPEALPPFYDEPAYLDAVAHVSEPHLRGASEHDLVLFSFHGLPERHVRKLDASGGHCLVKEGCCESISAVNRRCYRAQCYATARAVTSRLEIPPERYRVCFQSRLGRTPWIRPYTDEYYRTLPSQGVKRIAVLCPSFVADCLETLEEVAIRGREEFLRHGGEQLVLVPSLNADEVWVKAVTGMILKSLDRYHPST